MDTAAATCAGQLVADWPGLKRPQHLVVEQFLDALCISPLAPPAVLEVARRAHMTPYPPNWSEELDVASGALYFYNEVRDEASWQHPLSDTFRDVLALVAGLIAEKTPLGTLAAKIEEDLAEARRKATEELNDWVGPLTAEPDAPGGQTVEYFFNQRTEQSEWEDPREQWRYMLQVRYELLVGFLVAEERSSVARFGQGSRMASELTPTLTSLASSMNASSVASLLTSSLTAPDDAAREKAGLAPGDGETHWARPRPSRRGGLPLPPRATGTSSRATYSLAPHQQRYTSDMLQSPDSPLRNARSIGEPWGSPPSDTAPPPPPPPPGAPPRA
mmetsp:Transcript_60974/g.176492  ORF Transcript_60974/g.176492 Transcript_60974/m.176492 type:complete len:331 (-) Transcript_60974:51-1043(-)